MRSLGAKFTFIAGLCFCFLVGLFFIDSIVQERQNYAKAAINDIARDNFSQQAVMSPFIALPVTEVICSPKEAQNKTVAQCTSTTLHTIYADNTQWHNTLKVGEDFKKGIYHATQYVNQISIAGQFSPDISLLHLNQQQTVQWHKAKLYLPITDMRGLLQQPVVSLADKKYLLSEPALSENQISLPFGYTSVDLNDLQTTLYKNSTSQTGTLQSAAQANPSTQNEIANNSLAFKIDFSLSGLQSFRMLPLGKNIQASLDANWAHPNFSGGISPTSRSITDTTTKATWSNSYAPAQNSRLLTDCLQDSKSDSCTLLANSMYAAQKTSGEYNPTVNSNGNQAISKAESFNLQFFEPVNAYSLTDRTLKYSLLFLVIIFGTFFLFEMLKGLQVHPMQYALVGAAQGVFYLLLLSFSEQFSFGWAYLGSSLACVALISWYVSYVLNGVGRALSLGLILAAMYAALYVLLQSEQHTLMLGSVLVFGLIALVMFLTRHINWYRVNAPKV